MRRVKLCWHDRIVGTIPVPDSFRPPLTQAELDLIPAVMIVRSRSMLFDVRPGDVRLELRGAGATEEVVAVANIRLGPGDIGCILGFEVADDCPQCAPDEEVIALTSDLAKAYAGQG